MVTDLREGVHEVNVPYVTSQGAGSQRRGHTRDEKVETAGDLEDIKVRLIQEFPRRNLVEAEHVFAFKAKSLTERRFYQM